MSRSSSEEPDGVAEMQTWHRMRAQIQGQLEQRTGHGVDEWNRRIARVAPADEAALREWLEAQEVGGYPQMLLVWETFGYPDFLLASADELVDGQYADRPALRPVFDAVIAAVGGFEGLRIQARRTYVSLLTGRRTFAIVQPTTKTRLDVGLRLPDAELIGRLLLAENLGGDAITRRVALESVTDLDDAALGWIRRAYEESL